MVNTFPALGLSNYGMAWDAWSPGGPHLWLWSQNGSPAQLLASQVNPATGALTGVSFSGVGVSGEMAGGAGISVEVPGHVDRVCFLGVVQGTPDRISVFDLDHVIPVELSSFTIE